MWILSLTELKKMGDQMSHRRKSRDFEDTPDADAKSFCSATLFCNTHRNNDDRDNDDRDNDELSPRLRWPRPQKSGLYPRGLFPSRALP